MTRLFRRVSLLAVAAAAAAAALPAGSAAAAAPVPVPVLTGTLDGSTAHGLQDTTDLQKSVVLVWQRVTGASDYQVRISPNDEWTNNTVTLPNSGDTVNPFYEIPLSLPHATYYWQVRAKVGGTWGQYQSDLAQTGEFIRDWDVAIDVTKAPTASDPSIVWNPVQDASLYRVRFSTEPDFSGTNTYTCWTNATSFTPYSVTSSGPENATGSCFSVVDLTSGTSYYYEVRAFDDSTAPVLTADTSNDSGYECAEIQPECDASWASGQFTFEAPAGGSPTSAPVTGLATSWHTSSGTTACNAADPCPVTPTFSWTPVAGANTYHVQVTRDIAGSNTYRAYNTAWPELTPRDSFFDAQAGTSYYWTVWAGTCENSPNPAAPATPDLTCQSPGTGTPSYVAQSSQAGFNKTGGTVSLIAPANQAVVAGGNPTFSWNDFQSTGGDNAFEAENYDLQLATDSDFQNVVLDVPDIDLTRYTQSDALMADGNYFWRVAPIDESGNLLGWSSAREVTIDDTAPNLSLTTKSGVSVTGPLTFKSTQTVTGVSSSTVELVAANGSVVNGTVRATGSATSWTFTPASHLVTGQSYLLKLNPGIKDAAGNDADVTGSNVRVTTTADNTSKAWSFGSGWATHSASAAKGGSYRQAGKGKTASINVVGKTVTIYGCKGPSMGTLSVTFGGKSHSVNEHQSYTSCGVQVYHGSLPSGQVKVALKVTKSDGDVDELTVT